MHNEYTLLVAALRLIGSLCIYSLFVWRSGESSCRGASGWASACSVGGGWVCKCAGECCNLARFTPMDDFQILLYVCSEMASRLAKSQWSAARTSLFFTSLSPPLDDFQLLLYVLAKTATFVSKVHWSAARTSFFFMKNHP